MSRFLVSKEIERFFSNTLPEVLSISGRWGVGKTYLWNEELKRSKNGTDRSRYAYVSLFGLRELRELKMAIVQSTVTLDGENTADPSIESYASLLQDFGKKENRKQKSGFLVRKFSIFLANIISYAPYLGWVSGFVESAASLLIEKQIICIDDLARAGPGLDIADVMGLVSNLREQRHCKIVLLLNEDGLADEQKQKFQKYLEKTVDQAIRYEPTAKESATIALEQNDRNTITLKARAEILGITNIRVIRRIRRFLGQLEPSLAGHHDGLSEQVVTSIALLGWCVFERELAPPLEQVKQGTFNHGAQSGPEGEVDKIDPRLVEYDWRFFNELDELILRGLKAGAFETEELEKALSDINRQYEDSDIQEEIEHPWDILRGSFDDDEDEFIGAVVNAIEKHARDIPPNRASAMLRMLRALQRKDEAKRLLDVYLRAQDDKPREFFNLRMYPFTDNIDPAIAEAFEKRLNKVPPNCDLAEILRHIDEAAGWSSDDIAYLATIPVADYQNIFKSMRGDGPSAIVRWARRFCEMSGDHPQEKEVGRRMTEALRNIAKENRLNQLRLEPYLGAPGEQNHDN